MPVAKNRPHLIISYMQHISFIFSLNYLLITKSFLLYIGCQVSRMTCFNYYVITFRLLMLLCSIIQVGALSFALSINLLIHRNIDLKLKFKL